MGIRKYPTGPRVYIDLDGTLADFEASYKRHGHEPAIYKKLAGAYYQLDPIQGAIEAVDALSRMGLHTWILSKLPSENPYSATEKLLWVRRHLPSLADRVILSPDKGCVGSAGDFLIDDRPDWANADAFRGTVIAFKGDWRQTLEEIGQALSATGTRAEAR